MDILIKKNKKSGTFYSNSHLVFLNYIMAIWEKKIVYVTIKKNQVCQRRKLSIHT